MRKCKLNQGAALLHWQQTEYLKHTHSYSAMGVFINKTMLKGDLAEWNEFNTHRSFDLAFVPFQQGIIPLES